MPLFGLFNSKKDKKSSNGGATSTYGRSNASAVSEQDSESQWESISPTILSHDHSPDKLSAPSPSRIKMPFRRKVSNSTVASNHQTSPKQPSRLPKPFVSSSEVEIMEQLRPPMKSAMFASYGETQGQSTRSLPTTSRTAPDTSSYQNMVGDVSEKVLKTKKVGGLLSWARERTKSKPAPSVPPAENFNLKTFRHVRPQSPTSQFERPSSNYSLEPPPARPRPRGDSVASESSQRISVAAFREAQARRSATNSPIPSFRPPSSTDTLTTRALTPTRSTTQIDLARTQASRRSSALEFSSSSSSSEEEESDDDTVPNRHLGRRKRTITKRPAARAQTDIGHGYENDGRQSASLQRNMIATQSRSTAPQVVNSGNHPPSSLNAYSKSRGSVSTSALDPNSRTSLDFSGKAVSSTKRQSSDSDTSSNSSSDSDSDDAPLATLVGPRRPGSAMSGASSSRPRAPAKPLIDIKMLVTDRKVLSSSPEPDNTIRGRAMDKGKGKDVEHDDIAGLAKLAALARQAAEEDRNETSPSPPPLSAKVAQPQPRVPVSRPVVPNFVRRRRASNDIVTNPSAADDEPPRPASRGPEAPVTSTRSFPLLPPESVAPIRVVSPTPNETDDDDIMPALRFMMPKTYPDDDSPAPARAQVLESSSSAVADEKQIVPTPIRQRLPLSSFSVTSRPQHRTQQSSNSILTVTSNSTPTSSFASPAITPKITPSTASTSAASLASKTTPPRPGRPRSSTLTINTDSRPSLDNSSSSSSSSPSPRLPPSAVKKSAAMSMNRSMPSSPVKSTTSTMSQSSSGLTRRPRSRSGSSTLISQIPTSAPMNSDNRPQVSQPSSRTFSRPDTLVSRIPPSSSLVSATKPKPFASAMKRESPASSTGDSSSGRLPLTPGDGSDFGSKGSWDKVGHPLGGLQQGRDRKDYSKKRTVSFGEDVDFDRGRVNMIAREREREKAEKVETPVEGENRRRDRRRSEAKASIELGNVINGRGPIDDSEDEDDNDLGHHNMGPQFNPMMGMGANPMSFSHSAGPPGWNWQQQGQPSPSLMPPQFGSDPNYLMAHQQAMMIAKQTYQMAVAQQALAAAGDEWERNSNVSGFGGSQAFGATPGFGGPSMNMNVGMFGMGGGIGGFGSGMGMGMSHRWPNPSLMVPPAPRSAYGGAFGGAQSEYGGNPGGGGGWGSKSVYGESFGPSSGDRALRTSSATPRGQSQNRLQQQQEFNFPSTKGNRERERRNESSGHSNRADSGGNSSGQQHIRSGPRPRTLTAPSSSQTPVKVRRPEPSSPPPSSFRRFNGA